MNSSALATIKEVSDGILFKSGLPESKGAMIDQLTRDGYRELNLVVLEEGRRMELVSMDSNLIVYFPDDLIKVNDVFVPMDGQVWSLTRNTKIPKITVTQNGAEVVPDGWGDAGNIPSGEGVFFETGGGRNTEGYYDVDQSKRRIIFRNVNRSEVLLDYNSTGISKTYETYVPVEAKLALESFVMRELASFGVIPVNQFSLFEKRFSDEKAKLRMLDFNFTAFSDAVYETIVSSVYR